MPRLMGGLLGCAALAMLLAWSAARADDKDKGKKEEKVELPRKVMDALKAKFPKAKINKATKEKEGDAVVYDIEFTVDGKKTEADIKEDGTIINWEQEIPIKDLPKAVTDAIAKKYPKSKLEEAMKVTEVKDKKDVPGGYEVLIETEKKEKVEVELSEEGKIIKDSSEEKKEKKKDKKDKEK